MQFSCLDKKIYYTRCRYCPPSSKQNKYFYWHLSGSRLGYKARWRRLAGRGQGGPLGGRAPVLPPSRPRPTHPADHLSALLPPTAERQVPHSYANNIARATPCTVQPASLDHKQETRQSIVRRLEKNKDRYRGTYPNQCDGFEYHRQKYSPSSTYWTKNLKKMVRKWQRARSEGDLIVGARLIYRGTYLEIRVFRSGRRTGNARIYRRPSSGLICFFSGFIFSGRTIFSISSYQLSGRRTVNNMSLSILSVEIFKLTWTQSQKILQYCQ